MGSNVIFAAEREETTAVEEDSGDDDLVDGVGGPALEGVGEEVSVRGGADMSTAAMMSPSVVGGCGGGCRSRTEGYDWGIWREECSGKKMKDLKLGWVY